MFIHIYVLVMPVKQPSGRRPLRRNGYNFGASQNLLGSKLFVRSSTHLVGVLVTCQAIKRPNQVIFKVVVKEYGVCLKLDAKSSI